MRKIWNWIEDNAGPVMVTIAVLGGFAAIIQFSVVRPMQQGFDTVNQRIDDQIKYINQRFDAVDQRFDAQDRRIEDLVKDVSEFRKFSDRVTRSETRIDTLTEQLQTAGVIRHFRSDSRLRNAPSPSPGPGTVQAEIPALRDPILHNPETPEGLGGKHGTGSKDDAGPITATIAILGGFAAIIQFSFVRPMDQRFDAQDRRIEDLVKDVSELRKLSAIASPATKHESTPSPSSCRPPTRPRPEPARNPTLNLWVGYVGRISAA